MFCVSHRFATYLLIALEIPIGKPYYQHSKSSSAKMPIIGAMAVMKIQIHIINIDTIFNRRKQHENSSVA
jgi:hypothetical protein